MEQCCNSPSATERDWGCGMMLAPRNPPLHRPLADFSFPIPVHATSFQMHRSLSSCFAKFRLTAFSLSVPKQLLNERQSFSDIQYHKQE